jgi:hypothetical protein
MINTIDTVVALQSLKPNAEWVLRGDELEWLDTEQTQPTDKEIATEISRLQAEYDANQYQRDRAEAYPSTADQLDDIYHNGVDGWKATIKAVKDTYPKETI